MPRKTKHNVLLFALLLPALCLFASRSVRAEDKEGSAAQLVREVSLRKDPSPDSPSLGRLPKGTILTLQGNEKNGFTAVNVELEEGSVEGWIPKDALGGLKGAPPPSADEGTPRARRKKGKSDDDDDDEDDTPPPPPPRKANKKIKIPTDEGVLMRREQLFFYGVQAELGGAFITDDQGNLYNGLALGGGGHVGMFLDENLTARLEVGYQQLNGTGGPSGNLALQFGFINLDAVAAYWIRDFEISLGIQYAYGISLTDLPGGAKVDSASDLSSVGILGGLGYRVPLSDVTELVIRARYVYGFLQQPLNFQTVTGMIFLSFHG